MNEKLFLELPYPVSLNNFKRISKNKIPYKTKEANDFIENVKKSAIFAIKDINEYSKNGLYSIKLGLVPKKTKKIPKGYTEENYFIYQRRLDLDNISKVLFDALQGILYNNDNQIIHVQYIILKSEPEKKIKMLIEEVSEKYIFDLADNFKYDKMNE